MTMETEPRNVIAVTRFRGGPGRQQEAAEAWAFELTHYFTRGVGERPDVQYSDGVYTCTGLMTTTHPFDRDVTWFGEHSDPWDLDFSVNPERRARLRALDRPVRFDGRT